MSEIISIKQCKDKGYILKINPQKASILGLDKKNMGYAAFGTQKCYVNMKMSNDVQENEICLSQKVIDYLYLPGYPDFEIRTNGEEVMIGPHIGIYLCKTDKEITKDSLKNAIRYVSEYSKLHGSIVVFALDKVDQSKRLIEGYCYNPKLKDWERGIFPYPLSIYLWIAFDRDRKNHFLSAIGDTMFNNFYLNKYETYYWFSSDSDLIQHLPYTVLYKSSEDIFDMLTRYERVFVKPITGAQGKGIAQISLEQGRIAIRYHENENNIEKYFENSNESRELMEKLFTPDEYIVQQPIDLLTHEGRVMDFRLIIQKDAYGEWVCKVIIGRIGAAGRVVSNISSGGKAMLAEELFKKVLNLSDDEATALKEKISSFGFRVCNALVERGAKYGNLGLDIGIDKKGYPWLIEINSRRPDSTIAMDVNDKGLYHHIMAAPLYYGKFLAGFKPL